MIWTVMVSLGSPREWFGSQRGVGIPKEDLGNTKGWLRSQGRGLKTTRQDWSPRVRGLKKKFEDCKRAAEDMQEELGNTEECFEDPKEGVGDRHRRGLGTLTG